LSIIKLSSSGNSVWHKEIGGGSEEVSYSLSTATDGGFFLSGRSKSFNGGLSNMYVVKLDSGWTTCDYIYSTSNTVEAASGIWGNPSPNVFSISLTASASNCSVSSGGTAFSVCTYIPTVYSVSGTVRYQDNNQPVSSGCVKAVRFDSATNNIITVDSAQIQPNGTYTLLNCPPITLDIMAYENDEEDLYFVPTYYVSTIYWQNATHVKPDSSLVNIDIGVYRIVNPGANMHISGYIYKSSFFDDYDFIKDAFVYAKSGGFYKGYSISNAGGFYQIDSLSNGTYEIIVDRMGFYPATQFAIINGSSISNFNFNLLPIVKVEPNNTEVPEKFSLSQNYPNPFNPQTEIHFALPKESNVKLVIYDIIGREVAVLADGLYKAGIYSVNFEGTNIASGIYFYRIEAGDFTESRKMILLK
jgi:hypothetical protein